MNKITFKNVFLGSTYTPGKYVLIRCVMQSFYEDNIYSKMQVLPLLSWSIIILEVNSRTLRGNNQIISTLEGQV